MEPRLKTDIWVKSGLRRCFAAGIGAVIARRGDADAGAVLIKLNRLDGTFAVFAQARDGDGDPILDCVTGRNPVPESKADAYIDRQLSYDRDLWVVEIDDREGRLPWDMKILET